MRFIKKTFRYYGFMLAMFMAWNLYFLFLVHGILPEQLYYLDLLSVICFLLVFLPDLILFYRKEQLKKELLEYDYPVYQDVKGLEDSEIAAHDVRVLQEQLAVRFEENCELQDYVAKWCHEMKLPLSAALLMNEGMKDIKEKRSMRAVGANESTVKHTAFGLSLTGDII